jgi:perosamine synthetase
MISQSKPLIEKRDFGYIDEIIRSGQVARGKFVNDLQRKFAEMNGVRYAYATSNGTCALHLALLSLGIGEGDEVIVPSFTCTALLNAINYVKANPIIVDIDPETFNITYESAKKNMGKKTKAIIVTHTFGFPADMDRILKLNIPVIEDCAHAIGSVYKNKLVGSMGKVSVFSMYATKMLSSGEGGMVWTNDREIAGVIEDLNDPDMRQSYKVRYNYKMSDLAAGLALSQLIRLAYFISRRREIANRYKEALSRLRLKFQKALPEAVPNYYRFVICSSKAEEITKFSKTKGVFCDRPIHKPLHRYLNKNSEDFGGTELVWREAVSIPIYPALKENEISEIVEIFLASEKRICQSL